MSEPAKPFIVIVDDACGCTQETVCAVHQKPNQSAFPGEAPDRLVDLFTLVTSTPEQLDALMAKQYQPPAITKIEQTRTVVSTNGRDWVNYAFLGESAEPLNKYPHWQIWRGGELLIFHPANPVEPPACQATSETNESGVCGAPAQYRATRSRRPICDRCYLDHELDLAICTRSRRGHVAAFFRLSRMDRVENGSDAAAARACSPTLFGGVWNIGR